MCRQEQLSLDQSQCWTKGPSSAHILHGVYALVNRLTSAEECAIHEASYDNFKAVALPMQFRKGSDALPVKQDRLARPAISRHLLASAPLHFMHYPGAGR